jgi:hypothetical protein
MIDQERAEYIREMLTTAVPIDGFSGGKRMARSLLLYNSIGEIMELALQMPETIRPFLWQEADRPRVKVNAKGAMGAFSTTSSVRNATTRD